MNPQPGAPRLSVLLCTHAPKQPAISRVLRSLGEQDLHRSLWELIVIDNASTPPINERADLCSALTELDAKIIVETRLGLTRARLAAFHVAQSPVLVLVDDDTVLTPSYLSRALALFEEHPEVGAAGGIIRGEFATEPKRWMKGFLGLLAIRDFGPRPMRALVHGVDGPWDPVGAGMVLRKDVARSYAERADCGTRASLDRTGSGLNSCGDSDLARTASDLGLYLAYEPSLQLTHLIPAGRLRFGYLLRLAYSIARDSTLMRRMRGERAPDARTSMLGLLRQGIYAIALDPRITAVRVAQVVGLAVGERKLIS